jgi:hypothetical protein
MTSPLKSETARINGAKSRGPKTDQGRADSSMNAVKHGLTAKTLILPNENPDRFREMFKGYFDLFQPANQKEIELVSEIVGARWRLSRVRTYQTAVLDLEMDTQAAQFRKRLGEIDEHMRGALAFIVVAGNKDYATALRADVRMTRKYRRAIDNLRCLRSGNLLNKNKKFQIEPESPDLSPLDTANDVPEISTEPEKPKPVGQVPDLPNAQETKIPKAS